MRDDNYTPPGWTTNPSSWAQRLPIIIIALVGVAVSGYLALFQLGYLQTVWEPFFGNGSRKILESRVSKLISPGPVPDAALGIFGYLTDAVTGAIGGEERWRRRPWIVVIFGIAVGPLGVVSIALVIIQPVLVNAWCTLCLTSAIISLAMIGPALDETLASLQYLRRVYDRGGSVWQAFWKGSRHVATAEGEGWPVRSWLSGVLETLRDNWAREISMVLGVWLMAAPAVLGYTGVASATNRLVGPVVTGVAFVAIWPHMRTLRWVNLLMGALLLVVPWPLTFEQVATVNNLFVGLALVVLAPIRGPIRERFGEGWSLLWRGATPESRKRNR